jgi:DNA/RNA endonuclease YhcR with UshA esterase domain
VAHTITLKDNDIPNIVLGPQLVTVKENAGRIGVKIKVDKATTTQSRIRLFVKRRGDSTLIPGEFKLGSSNTDSTFNLGKSSGADSVTIFARIFDEFDIDPNDTVVLCVRQLSGPAQLKDSLFTLVMTDNDGPSQIRFDASSTTVNENAGSVKMKVRIAGRSDATADFSVRLLSSKSTATDGSDFTFGTAKVQSIDNNTPDSIEISVPIINDNNFETLEKAVFVLDNLSNTKILKPDTFTISIVSDDLPLYPISKVNAQTNANKAADSLGVRCRVTGTVHTPNYRTTGLSFMLADKTGGMGAFSSLRTYAYTPKEGDSIMIQGRVGQFQGTAQMDNLDTIIFIAGNRPLKTSVVVNDIAETAENTMVQVRRVKLVDPAEWPTTALAANAFKYVRIVHTTGNIDTLNIDAETDLDGTPAPVGYLNITGFGQQYDNAAPFNSRYVLTPRKLTDFQPASLPRINFFKKLDTITELADSFKFEVQVLPTDENFTFDVKVIGGTATAPLDYDFNGSTITVLKNNSYFAGKANISDDNVSDGPKTLIFGIRNIVGPGSVGSDSTLTLLITDNEASSVRTFAQGSLKMYPNPAHNSISISGLDPIQSLSIADMGGRVVKSLELDGEKQITTSLNLPAGVYLVQVTTGKGIFTERLIVK